MATATLSARLGSAARSPKKPFLVRVLDAIVESRMRKAMLDIERFRHLIPEDEVKQAGYTATLSCDAALPFTR